MIIVLFITCKGNSLSGQTPLVTGEINRYAMVTSIGTDYVIADDVSDFAVGDTVMIMQMSGVRINAGTSLPGNYQNKIGSPGYYEIVLISAINTGTGQVSFSRNLLNTYDAEGKVQIVKVRSYRNAVVNSELSCQTWDSTLVRGGVLVFLVKGTLTLNAGINVNGRGFKGGIISQGNGYCQSSSDTMRLESYSIYSFASGYKGEGLGLRTATDGSLYPSFMKGKGTNLTGGGGGNGHLSGGGGGSNYGAGSEGDVEVPSCAGLMTGGRGGYALSSTALSGGVFMGGGGGASVWLTTATTSAGGNGGGIIIIHADSIAGNGMTISATGSAANNNTVTGSGAAGGGGGGSVIISTRNFSSNPVLSANGGKGGNNISQNGAGGGGGGGLIWTINTFTGTATVTGGLSGTHSEGDPNKDGDPGAIWTSLNLPLNGFLFNEIYFEDNLNTVDSICEGMIPPKITGTMPAGGSGSYTYQWQKSYDNTNWSDVAGTTIDYTPTAAESDTLWFRRVVNDGSGITDISKSVTVFVHPMITGNLIGTDSTLCYNQDPEALYPLNSGPSGGTGLYSYSWEESPDNTNWNDASGINTGANYNPPSLTATTYYQRVVTSGACTDISTPVTITVLPSISGNTVTSDQTVCEGTLFNNLAGSSPEGGDSPSYTYQWKSSTDNVSWTDAAGTNTNTDYDPQDDSPGTTYYRRLVFSGPYNTCQSTSNTVQLVSHPSITNNIITDDQTICEGSAPATLDGTVPSDGAGAGTYLYQWVNSSDGTTFQNISGATGEDLTGTALSSSTWYRRVVTSSVCSDTSNDIKITIDPAITGFEVVMPESGHDTICTGTIPAQLTGSPAGGLGTYSYSWASSTDNVNYSDLGVTTETYQPGTLTSTTWFRRTVTSGTCSESYVFRITVLSQVTGNTIASAQTICNTQTPDQLTGSTPDGGDGVYRYLWESREEASTEWTNASGTNNNANYQPSLLDGTTQFRRNVFSGEEDCCSSVSDPVTVTVDIMPQNISAGEDRTLFPYQFAALLEGSFDGEGTASWNYDFTGKGDPVFSNADERTTEVTKLGFGDNTFIFSVVNGTCVADDVYVTLTVPELIIPQGVTPNGDNINDYFNVEGLEYTQNELVIINSSGAVVYKANDYRSDDPVNAWTGLDLNGNEVPEGTYYYLLTITGAEDISVPEYTVHISGFIILRR